MPAIANVHPHTSSITTCVIADHWLGAEYVHELLKCDAAIAVVSFDHTVECAACQQRMPMFIIDYGGLRLPFSQCLITLRRKFPSACYLILGHQRPQEDVMRFVQLGVDGFIPYQDVAATLVRAVHAVAAGQLWVDANILTRLLKSHGRGTLPLDHQSVTLRESQILELAKGRLTNKEIGVILGIQESTVKYHLTNLFTKLRINSRDELLENPDPTGCWRKLLQSTSTLVTPSNPDKRAPASYCQPGKTGT
jgi:DNA-binding NarL/FixJ family response regulator